jgi:GTP cyclohydrolase II
LCEIVNRGDGSMARTPQLLAFAQEHGLKCITIADMIRYRLRHEQLLEQVAEAQLDTRYGVFNAVCFKSLVDGAEHVALVAGNPRAAAAAAGAAAGGQQQQQQQAVLARVQQQRRLIDVFGSLHCGQGPFLDVALQAIALEGTGVVLYVASHNRDGGCSSSLAGELQEYADSQQSCDIYTPPPPTITASGSVSASASSSFDGFGVSSNRAGPSSSLSPDLRDTAAAAHMLRHLGVSHVRLMTNDESEAQRMRCCGVEAEVVGWGDGSSYGASDGGLLQQQQQQQLQAMLGHLSNGTSSSSSTAANNGAVGAGL